jgi:hypothetical protein|tara:strand:- start:139 stop:393 length:255 start_codon:yes stop_codon:yes gene_type:complete
MLTANGKYADTFLAWHVPFKGKEVVLLGPPEALNIAPLTGIAQYRVRSRDEVDVDTVDEQAMHAIDPTANAEVLRTLFVPVDVQ